MSNEPNAEERPFDIGLYIRVALDRTYETKFPESAPRNQFWGQISSARASRHLNAIGPIDGEVAVVHDLSSYLTNRFFEEIVSRRDGEVPPSSREDRGAEYQIKFDVAVVGYGSILLYVGVTSAKVISDYLNKDFDLFVALTETFLLAGVRDTFGLDEGTMVAQTTAASLERARTRFADLSVVAAPDVAGSTPASAPAPSTPPAPPAPPAPSPPASPSPPTDNWPDEKKRRYIGLLLQGSLIVPVFLALIVCGVLVLALFHEREIQKAEGDRLSSERTGLLDFSKAQLASLSQQNADLSKVLAQSGASEVIAIVQQNTELMKGAFPAQCCCGKCCTTRALPRKPIVNLTPKPPCY